MLKNHKWKWLLSSIVILLPMLLGLVFWNKLPEVMPTHWGFDGKADGWGSRAFVVFGVPVLMLGVHWLCVWITAMDRKNKKQNDKVLGLTLWLWPILSLYMSGMSWAASLGHKIDLGSFTFALLGLPFTLIGNYLPKCRQNHTIGIKLKWTLENEENWNATHRFGGKVWFTGGLLMMLSSFLPSSLALSAQMIALLFLVLLPTAYSFLYHRKQLKEGTVSNQPAPKAKADKIAFIISIILIIALLLVLGAIMFTGDIGFTCTETSLAIEASFWNDLTVAYQAIEHIEYREYAEAGSRVHGFGSARLLAGMFENDEFGNYTRYSYVGSDACVVLNAEGKTLVIGTQDVQTTRALYEQIKLHLD